jgi:hypothetical protein
MSEIAAVPHLPSLLIDAHVHFHPGFRRDDFLDAALANFARGASELGIDGPVTGCLMLAETAEERWFLRLSRQEEGARFGAWQFESAGDDAVLTARRQTDGATLLIVAGRQVRSREGLEVLALATREEFPDGLPFSDALTRVRWSGAVTVIPWGFGKWWLYRGALVEAALHRVTGPGIFLGDNAGRPQSSGRPRLFREAEARGIPVLPGSDPLPLPEQATRAGSYGFLLEGALDPGQPVQSLKQALGSLTPELRTFGRRASLACVCRDQLALRLRSRHPDPVAPAAVPRTERAVVPSSWTR